MLCFRFSNTTTTFCRNLLIHNVQSIEIYLYHYFFLDATFGNEATQYAATFKGMRLGSKPTASPIHQSVTKSPIMCSVTCLRDFQTCRSFTYEKQSNTCLLYPEIYTLTTDFNHMDGYTYYQLESYV